MFEQEMNDLIKIYEGDIEATQQEMDEQEESLVYFMKKYVELYERRENTHKKLEEVKDKQKKPPQGYNYFNCCGGS